MVDKTLPALDAVVTPVATDILLTRQAADTEDRRYTRAQARQLLAGEQYDGTNAASGALLNEAATATNPTFVPNKADLDTGMAWIAADQGALVAGGVQVAAFVEATAVPQFILPQVNAAVTPTLAFGDGDSGIFESADDTLQVVIGGLSHILISSAWAFRSILSDGPGMRAVEATATIPTVNAGRNDTDTGLGWTAFDRGSIIAGGVQVAEYSELAGLVQMIFPQQNNAGSPSIAFGDGDTGFYENIDDVITIAIAGSGTWQFSSTTLGNTNGARPCLRNEVPSATNPVICVRLNDLDTGISSRAADVIDFIAGGLQCMEIEEIAAAPAVGFYATPAIVLQTGVAVTAAGVHAALVNLGLITA